ncbi:helix-turn-helix transcriptional regulator [Streptomyces lunaelactis]|uniref:Helix-turn-helix transcriptional regulator n=1 Tax=Streptomyces lunaelactis TaxID=1535768 RepID=A0A2R4T5P5_9ACTN|nr:LuxR C-terminal-related transcriptional regulator [Streptomyces lunaelactis]AVZ74470.1 helix-turn-helix transcriptional regulator [Streptomyces lunaelactis]NUK85119.1 LuxR family transcriptional regulator [Streptomyces lunaelactis]
MHAVYRHTLRQSPVTVEGIASSLGLALAVAQRSCTELAELGLLREDAEAPSGFVAVDPETAAERVISPMERSIRAQRSTVETLRGQLLEFSRVYEEQPARSDARGSVEFLATLSSTRAAIAELASKCESEVLTSQPGGGRKADVLEEAIARDEAMLERGVSMRTLYQHTARFSQGTREYVERVSQRGAEVRTLDDQFVRLLMFDQKVAVIGVEGDPGAAIIVREPNLIHFIRSTFELWWVSATPFPLEWNNQEVADISEQLKQRITLLLSEGLTDQSIATRMGMSVRTCRRHIAEVMDRLGVKSRFQAGYLLGTQRTEPPARPPTAQP